MYFVSMRTAWVTISNFEDKITILVKAGFSTICTFKISLREELGRFRVIDLVENVESGKFQSIYHFLCRNNFCCFKVEEKHGSGLPLSAEPRPPTGGCPWGSYSDFVIFYDYSIHFFLFSLPQKIIYSFLPCVSSAQDVPDFLYRTIEPLT